MTLAAPSAQTLDNVLGIGEAGHEDDWQVGRRDILPKTARRLETVHPGHDAIYQHQVGNDLLYQAQRRFTGGRHQCSDALSLKRVSNKAERLRGVIHYKHAIPPPSVVFAHRQYAFKNLQ